MYEIRDDQTNQMHEAFTDLFLGLQPYDGRAEYVTKIPLVSVCTSVAQ
jgi:hypothetical protein